ncbi:phage gp6-like head-tail connector protein [Clostridium botulinum]|uniref:head-tail connector protein n=1 Tax=Clostridium botulinum TaxID=1491 RepID=UPI0013758EEF|nr:head-tail connector protein [Clostridium botulinum]MCJ8173972.1 head-tail connector protein [Clostridium botulinum]NCI22008.1 phage gp6-like head-tail connector protein [Clostridium botulinum]NCI37742.1 phage gp6-like head-tail connector protein [Clostridium botulinum]NCI74333.1 phage gp6-like head-tail connector protein [Clostridium botulinum]NDI40583.1 phage gp6-like head-tail connector protein [Clostridium botulinum]
MTLEEIKDYIIVDDESDNLPEELMEISQIYIDSMVGEGYKQDEKMVKLASLLQRKLCTDMYENRSTEISQSVKQDRITTSILDKLSNYDGDINV